MQTSSDVDNFSKYTTDVTEVFQSGLGEIDY